MSDGYAVNIAELGTLIRTLEDGAEQVRQANKKLADGDRVDLGSETITSAAGAFEEEWEWGLDKLDEAAEHVIERLRSTKKNYQELEEGHRELLNKTEQRIGDGTVGAPGSGLPGGPAGGAQRGGDQPSADQGAEVGGGTISDVLDGGGS